MHEVVAYVDAEEVVREEVYVAAAAVVHGMAQQHIQVVPVEASHNLAQDSRRVREVDMGEVRHSSAFLLVGGFGTGCVVGLRRAGVEGLPVL